ncbi:MAG: leucine-rich repeat domain-containing protein [Bacteroidales bacterium]|nr:leucine-rich repeat domain-containing protein [Bacteroidales bacterium]
MKRIIVICLLALTAVYGCQVNELVEVGSEAKSFTASIEDNCTKTSLDDQGNVLFKQGDQMSIFVGSTINEQYQVTDDSDGKTSASLIKVTGPGFVAGGEIDNNIAFYPYASAITIARNGNAFVLRDITLPSTQNYAEGSFGNGAFPMAAVTSNEEDMHLKFKNVLGGVKLQLTGTGVVKSVSISGNGNEILCGAAEVTVSNTSTPAISLTDASAKTVTLDCGDGVQLNSETATSFIIALPPMTMEGGFTVVVTDTEGKQMEIKTTKPQTINRTTLLKMPEVAYEGTPAPNGPLTFMSTGETSIALTKVGSPDDISLEYKVGIGDWMEYTIGEAVSLNDGQTVSFRAGAEGNDSFSKGNQDYYKFVFSGSGTVAASGNVMSLVSQEETLVIPSEYYFISLFRNCTSLTSAPELPATDLARFCYGGMFYGCTSLTSVPELHSMILAEYCYADMFSGCTGLTTAPELPATTLADYCYRSMFWNCTSMTAAPELPATDLARFCYGGMFYGCTSLTSAPELHSMILADHCYFNMFSGCTGLTTAPELPATDLTEYCYSSMFNGCTSLTSAPELPATALTEHCYANMFSGCTSLTSAPELPATTLADYCYRSMFYDCTGLTTAPELPATTLADYCYRSMFWNCTSMTAAPELPATTLADHCYYSMFYGCTGLTTAPELPATTLATSCYSGMFSGCTSMTTVPDLPATTLAPYCYQGMFNNCTGLTTAPVLPATTLATYCYQFMFKGCTGLTTAPELPATTLADRCYYYMFSGCTNLTAAPELPATTLAEYCYNGMFYNCTSLKYIKCLATDLSATNCLSNWVYGVSPSGVFIKDPDTIWPTGTRGIPEGWTIYPTGLPTEAEAVDLGLSVKWANINIGATSPEEYGGFFAWGETEPKYDYSWGTYKLCNGDAHKLTKYCPVDRADYWDGTGTPDGKTVLDPEDDAAHVNWGGNWRMPTDAEWEELKDNCTWTLTMQNGINGCRGTSNINGNSIFLPASGTRYDTYNKAVGDGGYYLSSSLSIYSDYSCLRFYEWGFALGNPLAIISPGFNDRCFGSSIRPVSE